MKPDISAQELGQFLAQQAVFEHLPGKDLHALLSRSRLHALAHRKVLQAAGDPHHHLWVVVRGEIAMVARSEDGEELTLAIFGAGSTSSWIAQFHDTPAERNLVGSAGSTILGIPRKVALNLLEDHPKLYPLVLKIEANRFRAALNLQQHNLIRERPRRVAGLLLMLAEMSGDATVPTTVRLTSQELAQMAHCSRQSLYQSIQSLQSAGAVKQRYGRIEIMDKEALRGLYHAGVRARP